MAQSTLGDDSSGGSAPVWSRGNFHLAIAIGVLVVAYFGLASQYFMLRFGRRGATFFALFLFLAWLVPLVAGTILAMASMYGDGGIASQMCFGLTPVSGIAMVAAPYNDTAIRTAIQGPAITPALLFTFVFSSLLVSARRRAHKEFLVSSAGAEKPNVARSALSGESAELESGESTLRPEVS